MARVRNLALPGMPAISIDALGLQDGPGRGEDRAGSGPDRELPGTREKGGFLQGPFPLVLPWNRTL